MNGGGPRRWPRVVVGGGAVLLVLFMAGPRPGFVEQWSEVALAPDWEARLAQSEAAVPDVRPGDRAGVVWIDSAGRAPTPVSLVYLHGFSADRHEMEPVVSRVGAELGANVFFTRLTGHGRDAAAMGEATVEAWLDDVARAFAVGRAIGERVVLVGTSTGGTLATWAAARPEVEGDLAALVLVSPNFHPADRMSRVLLWPWGGALARVVTGPERCFRPANAEQERHWTTCYPTSALLPMMAITERVRTMDLSAIEAPTLVLYAPDDRVVDPAETEAALERMTSAEVRVRSWADTDDPGRHVLAGDILSPASTAAAIAEIADFVRSVVPEAGVSEAGVPEAVAPEVAAPETVVSDTIAPEAVASGAGGDPT